MHQQKEQVKQWTKVSKKEKDTTLLLANTDGAKEASIGMALGRLSSTPVQRNIGRVKDGPVEQTQAYFTNGAKVESLSSAWESIADKRYIFLRNFAGKAGFYFTDDPTLTSETDDFKTLANGFVMDKAVIIAYNVLVENLGDEIPVSENGSIHPAIIKSWQNAIESNINGQMTANGELSSCKAYIDEKQDVLRTGKMEVDMDDLGGKLKDAITQLDEATKRIKELEDTVEMLTDELKKYKQLNRKREL